MPMKNTSEENESSDIVMVPSEATKLTYQIVSGVFGVLELYLFLSLLCYELFIPDKPRNGRTLRVLGLCAVFVSILFEFFQQFLVLFTNKSTMVCFTVIIIKMTIQNSQISFCYAFIWLRQYRLYSSCKFQDLRGKKMKMITWVVLALIIVNPFLMFGFQFNGELYKVVNDLCLVVYIPFVNQIPFLFVSFSYGFIQVSF